MKFFTFLLLVILIAPGVSAQRKIKVRDGHEKIAGSNNPVMVITIYESDKDKIEKAWKKLMKDYNAKVSMKDEVFADDATISDLGSNTCDVYAKVNKTGEDEYELIVAVDLGGAFLNESSHGDKYRAMKKIIYDFAVETTKDAIREKMRDAEKALEKMEREKQDLVKDNERLVQLIEDCKAKITKAEQDIETNKNDQTNKDQQIEGQKKVVEEIAGREKAVE